MYQEKQEKADKWQMTHGAFSLRAWPSRSMTLTLVLSPQYQLADQDQGSGWEPQFPQEI